jgi:hypothetical protein
MKRPLLSAVFALAAVLTSPSHAQDFETVDRPFRSVDPLPVAPYRTSSATAVAPSGSGGQTLFGSGGASKKWDIYVKDINVYGTFQRWARDAHWQVRWDAGKHVMIEAPDTLQGSFEDAVQSVLESPGIALGPYPLEVCFYPNTPPLARVTRKGDQAKECN